MTKLSELVCFHCVFRRCSDDRAGGVPGADGAQMTELSELGCFHCVFRRCSDGRAGSVPGPDGAQMTKLSELSMFSLCFQEVLRWQSWVSTRARRCSDVRVV